MTKLYTEWQKALKKQYHAQCGEDMDTESMKLLHETNEYWLVSYCEGGMSGEFINCVYKDERDMQTLEV